MTQTIYFISHPNVEISAIVPVTQWPLSELGRARMLALCEKPWMKNITSVYCSDEQKAIDSAEILSQHLQLNFTKVKSLGENDRSSTGYLQAQEFEAAADKFFLAPNESMMGWETANSAQSRIVQAITDIARDDKTEGDIAIVSHGAVGTLLYCYLDNKKIDRTWDQPGQGGGNYFKVVLTPEIKTTWWAPID